MFPWRIFLEECLDFLSTQSSDSLSKRECDDKIQKNVKVRSYHKAQTERTDKESCSKKNKKTFMKSPDASGSVMGLLKWGFSMSGDSVLLKNWDIF